MTGWARLAALAEVTPQGGSVTGSIRLGTTALAGLRGASPET